MSLSPARSVQIWDVEVDGSSNVTRALLGSTLMSALLTIMYLVIAFLVILGRWCSAETDAGLWFGVLMGATWTMAFVYAQAGISTQAFDDKVCQHSPCVSCCSATEDRDSY